MLGILFELFAYTPPEFRKWMLRIFSVLFGTCAIVMIVLSFQSYHAVYKHETDPAFHNDLSAYNKIVSANKEAKLPAASSDKKNLPLKIIINQLALEKSMYKNLTLAFIFVSLSLGMYILSASVRERKSNV